MRVRAPTEGVRDTMTKSEQETQIQWDQEGRMAGFYTTYWPDARYWEKQGLDVRVVDRDADGQPRAWGAGAPCSAVRIRPVCDGQVVRKTGHRRGRLFKGDRDDQVVESEDRSDDA